MNLTGNFTQENLGFFDLSLKISIFWEIGLKYKFANENVLVGKWLLMRPFVQPEVLNDLLMSISQFIFRLNSRE